MRVDPSRQAASRTRAPLQLRRGAVIPIGVAVSALFVVAACTQNDAPARPPRDATVQAAPAARTPSQHTKSQAHAELARRLQPFLIERGGTTSGRMAADDERLRLGAFWKARTDTHHFNADFHARAAAALALAGDDVRADTALRQLLVTIERRLPAWQALVDYNASGRMRDDGGEGGRQLLPGCIAAIDALEAAAWNYVTAAQPSTVTAPANGGAPAHAY